MTRQDVNGAVVDLVPANVGGGQEFLEKSRRHPDVILDHLNNAKPRPLSPHYLEVSEIQQNMVQKILSGAPSADGCEGGLLSHRRAAVGQEELEASRAARLRALISMTRAAAFGLDPRPSVGNER